jgi:hypothetical protein
MIQYRKQKTHKLFYGKYPYKISTMIKNGTYLRVWSIKQIMLWCTGEHEDLISFYHPSNKSSIVDKQRLFNYCKSLKLLDANSYKLRIEGSHVNYFFTSKDAYEKAINVLEEFVICVTEPEDTQVLNTIVGDKKTVVCNELPHGKYTHKVIFKQMPLDVRNSLLEWTKKYNSDMVRVSPSTERYLSGSRYYQQDPFLYVSNKQMLMMVGLAAQGYVSRTEQFIPRSSINISS